MRPKVSVIIPTYNNGPFIEQTIASVLSQVVSFPVEIIVVDDGSTDHTSEKLAACQNRIRYVYQANAGVSAARNLGLSLATGQYVVFLDGDDLLLPGKLAAQAAVLDSRPELGGVHSGWQLIDESGRPLRNIEPWHQVPTLNLPGWLFWKPVFLGAMMIRRQWLERIEGFDTTLRQAEDVDVLWRLSLLGCRFDWLKQPTVGYRQHPHNTLRDGLRQARDMNQNLDKFFTRADLPARIRRLENEVRYYTQLWLIWQLYRTGYDSEIVTYLRLSRQYSPDDPIMTAQRWCTELYNHARRDGIDQQQLSCFWPHFQTALNADDVIWPQIQFNLEWWEKVWRPYTSGDYQAGANGLKDYRGLTPDRLLALARLCLIAGPAQSSVAAIDQFWRDASACGLVAGQARPVSLYLTLAGQSFLGRNWRTGGQAIWRALRASGSKQALRAWGSFLKSAANYFFGHSALKTQNIDAASPFIEKSAPEQIKLSAK